VRGLGVLVGVAVAAAPVFILSGGNRDILSSREEKDISVPRPNEFAFTANLTHVISEDASVPAVWISRTADAGVYLDGRVVLSAHVAMRLVQDPSSFLGTTTLRCETFQEQPALRIVALDATSAAAELGVLDGDLLLNLNGAALTSDAEVLRPRVWDGLADHGAGTLFLIRRGEALTIDYAVLDGMWFGDL
jgi:hypothetical protein